MFDKNGLIVGFPPNKFFFFIYNYVLSIFAFQ